MANRTAGFDLVAAVTEDALNFQFDLLFRQGVLPKSLRLDLADTGLAIDAELAAPTVRLSVPDTTSTVLFLLHLRRGTFSYYEGFGPTATRRQVRIENWIYAFRVDMKFAALDRKTLPAGARRTLEAFDDEQFTVRQLLLDLADSRLSEFDRDATSMPLPDGSKPSPNTLAQWQAALAAYFASLSGGSNPYVLGYTVQARHEGKDAAALLGAGAATCSTFHNPDSPGTSTLNFLIKAGETLPAVPPNGVFGEPLVTAPDYDGAMVVDADVFRTAYLEGVLLPAIARAVGVPELRPRSTHGERFGLVWTSAADVATLGRLALETPLLNVYEDHREHREVVVVVSPGSRITVTGNLRTEYGWYQTPFGGRVDEGGAAVTQDWTATLTLGAGVDGRLSVVLSEFDHGTPRPDRPVSPAEFLVDLIDRGLAQSEADFAAALGRYETDVADEISTSLRDALAVLNTRVVLPGGDVFFFSDAALDTDFNLVADVQYKAERPARAAAALAADPTVPPVTVHASAEFMTNHEPGRVLDPQRHFGAFQDHCGEPALLSIGTDNVARLVHRDGSSATGWAERALGTSLARGARPAAFGAGQNVDGTLHLALAFDDGVSSRLYVTPRLGNDLSAPEWTGIDRSWVERPADRAIGRITSIAMAATGDGAAPLTIVATEQDGQAYHWIVDADVRTTGPTWQRYVLPENAHTLIDLSIGMIDGARGVYALYDMLDGTRRLEFTSLPDPRYHKTANYEFDLPARVECIEAMAAVDGASDLYAAGDGLYVYPASAQQAGTVATKDALPPVTELLSRTDGTTTSLFAVTGDDELWHCHGAGRVWSAPALVGRDCAQVAALRSRVWLNNHVLIARPDGSPGYLWQDPGTGLWSEASIPLPKLGTVVTYPSYTTQLQLLNVDGTPAAGVDVRLATSTVSTVVVNGGQHRAGPDRPIKVTSDDRGFLTVVCPTTSLSTPRLTVVPTGSAPVAVQPAQQVLDRLAQIRTAEDLTAATLRSGPQAGAPLLSQPQDPGLVQGVSYILGRLCGPAPTHDGECYGLRITAEKAALLLGEDALSVLDDVRDTLRGNPGDLLRHLRQTADAVQTLVVDARAQSAELVVELREQVYRFALTEIEHLLEAVDWLLTNLLHLSLDDLLHWLGFGFAWDDIQRTHRMLRNMVNWTLDRFAGEAEDLAGTVSGAMEYAKRQLRGPDVTAALERVGRPQATAKARRAGLDQTGAATLATLQGSPSSNWAQHHLFSSGALEGIVDGDLLGGDALAAFVDDILKPAIESLRSTLSTTRADLIRAWTEDLTPVELFRIVGVDVMVGILDVIEKIVMGLFHIIGDLIAALRNFLNAPVDVPVLGALYKQFIDGDELSILDLACLVAAFPTTIAYHGATGQRAADELAAAGLEDGSQGYRAVFDRLSGPSGTLVASFALAAPGADAKSTWERVGWHYARVGVVASVIAEGIISIVTLAQQVGSIRSGNTGPTTTPIGKDGKRILTWWDIFLAAVDVISTVGSYPVGTDLEVKIQFLNWLAHGVTAIGFPLAKKLLTPVPGADQIDAETDLAIGTGQWCLTLATFIIEMVDASRTQKGKEDLEQNLIKFLDNYFQWVTRECIDLAKFDLEPATKKALAFGSAFGLALSVAMQATRLEEGYRTGRELQRY